jgi:hypothetical protein
LQAFGQNLENTNSMPRDAGMWKHKAELLAAQNKVSAPSSYVAGFHGASSMSCDTRVFASTLQRLKDRVDELAATAQKRTTGVATVVDKHRLVAHKLTPFYARSSTSFRNQLLAIRRRRRLHEEKGTLSGTPLSAIVKRVRLLYHFCANSAPPRPALPVRLLIYASVG